MISAEETPLRVSTASDPGKGAKHNEDRYRLEVFSLGENNEGAAMFAIVADGIGVHRAGEVAAELAVETIARRVAQSDASQPAGILQAAIIQASQAILARSESRREWKGMGSTCLCAWLVADRLYTACVGNSRLYLLRGRLLQQLNVPQHSAREQLSVSKPKSKRFRKEAEEDPLRGYLGSKTPVEVDLRLVVKPGDEGRRAIRNQGLRLLPNDRLLLCTDGLGDALEPHEILEILGSRELENVALDLVQFALEKGTPNNMTAVVIALPPGRPPLLAQPLNWRRALASTFVVALLVLFGLFAWWLWQGQLNPMRSPTPTAINTLTPLPTNTPE